MVSRKKSEKEVGRLARLRRRADDGAVITAQHLAPGPLDLERPLLGVFPAQECLWLTYFPFRRTWARQK
jgi:hypothetical protein